MTALRVFPFVGALVAIAAVVLSIIGISTTYWFDSGALLHSGLWQNCIASGCMKTEGGRTAAMAL
ncbi:unnamed protein product, partial [Rotaria socialis]